MTFSAEDKKRFPGLGKPPIRVWHENLKLISEESRFRVWCPVCKSGVMCVSRDQRTFKLVREDRCHGCGQEYFYLDDEIDGEKFPHKLIDGIDM